MFGDFIEKLRSMTDKTVIDDGTSGVKLNPTTKIKSGKVFERATGDYNDDNTSVALFSYNDNNGDRRYGHLFIPQESLHNHDKNPSAALQVIGAELDDGSQLDYNQAIKLLKKVDTTSKGSTKIDRSKEQFTINIPTGNEIEGTTKKWFSVDDLRDAYDTSRKTREDFWKALRKAQFKEPIQFKKPDLKKIIMP